MVSYNSDAKMNFIKQLNSFETIQEDSEEWVDEKGQGEMLDMDHHDQPA